MRRYLTSMLLVLLACGSDSSNFGNAPTGGNGVDGGDGGANNPGGGVVIPGNDGGGLPDGGGECSHSLKAIIRDFRPCGAEPNATSCTQANGHLDFEHYRGDGVAKGIVGLGLNPDDHTPVWIARGQTNEGPATTDAARFHDWYHTKQGVNIELTRQLDLVEQAGGHYVYERTAFFPIDDDKAQGTTTGFGNGPKPPPPNENIDHNFEFTTEVRLSFTYRGGETFEFYGDDDLWVFVDGKLALDLGGPHPPARDRVNMDARGLTVGKTYSMDLFHAERHTEKSTFRVDTTIECFKPPVH
ncbi:fibro-slime domain-containing protein [Pendulispora rubella]|uniref:Fibro-slime domain-containing protein n=2 Tax=Pendulispora rubella TaxID=2741070 RepID=A0ABZ2KWI1_9BACT